jgi:hypothetical protein
VVECLPNKCEALGGGGFCFVLVFFSVLKKKWNGNVSINKISEHLYHQTSVYLKQGNQGQGNTDTMRTRHKQTPHAIKKMSH